VEAAHAYQYRAQVSPIIARRQDGLPKAVTDIAWKAQLRLCADSRCGARLEPNKAVVAIARSWPGSSRAVARQIPPGTAG
jgi:hypothetical protein